MIKLIEHLASPRLAIFGMILLAIGAGLSYGNPASTPMWVLVAPLALLSLSLTLAIATNPRINRRRGLLLFHVGLLAIVILVAIGRLTFFEARLELVEDNAFNSDELFDVKSGAWHRKADLAKLNFVQHSYSVEYFPELLRGRTFSNVSVQGSDGVQHAQVVGDDRPLVIDGYRFYTTFNKGFAPVLTWIPRAGESVSGAVHMPSYPLFAHKQTNVWTPSGSDEIKFWLQLETGLDEKRDWTLDSRRTSGVLVVNAGDKRVELKRGESVELPSGTLRYDRLASWMGYKVFYDPTLHYLFIAALCSVVGLFWHFWQKFGVRMSVTELNAQIDVASTNQTWRGAA